MFLSDEFLSKYCILKDSQRLLYSRVFQKVMINLYLTVTATVLGSRSARMSYEQPSSYFTGNRIKSNIIFVIQFLK